MRETLDVLNLLEVAYQSEAEDDAWMRSLVEASEPVLGRGLGATGYFVDASLPDSFRTWAFQCTGLDEVDERARFAGWSAHAPTGLKRHAHLHGVAAYASQMPPGEIAPQAFDSSFELTGRADVLGIAALDSSARGCALAFPCAERQVEVPTVEQALIWERIAAHIAAALRLRRARRDSSSIEPEAVLSPAGRVEHATGLAKDPEVREHLRAAAVGFDRARTGDYRGQPVVATQMWRAMVGGRWTLVDQFDRDGRRYIVARPNEPVVDPLERLSARESQVLRAAALGHSNKMIAYELGIAQSTVSSCLKSAAATLGVDDRLGLIRLAASRLDALPKPPAPDAS